MTTSLSNMSPRMLEEDSYYSYAWQGAGLAFVFVASLIGVGFSYFLAHLHHKENEEYHKKNVENCEKAGYADSVTLTLENDAPDHMHVHNHDVNTGKDHLSGVLDAVLIFLKGLGVGIIISVALVHLINEAYDPFTDAGWISDDTYDAWPMVFAIIGILLMAMIEFTASTLVERSYELQTNADATELSARELRKKKRLALMVELSILAHSVLVGFDLGLQYHDGWQTLVIAICFHQFFEGIALAQVVGDAKRSKLSAAVILIGFCLVTPLGIGIGMATMSGIPTGEDGDDVKPQWANILIGIIDGLCGGVLLYVGLLSLLLPWFIESKVLKSSKTSFVYIFLGWLGIVLGLAIMCVIGIWA